MPTSYQSNKNAKCDHYTQIMMINLQDKYAETFQKMLGESAKLETHHRAIFDSSTSEDVLKLAKENRDKSDKAFAEINESTRLVHGILSDFCYFNNTELSIKINELREHTDKCEKNLELLGELTLQAEMLLKLVKESPGTSKNHPEEVEFTNSSKNSIETLKNINLLGDLTSQAVRILTPATDLPGTSRNNQNEVEVLNSPENSGETEKNLYLCQFQRNFPGTSTNLQVNSETEKLKLENSRLQSENNRLENNLECEKQSNEMMRQANTNLQRENAFLLGKIREYERMFESNTN